MQNTYPNPARKHTDEAHEDPPAESPAGIFIATENLPKHDCSQSRPPRRNFRPCQDRAKLTGEENDAKKTEANATMNPAHRNATTGDFFHAPLRTATHRRFAATVMQAFSGLCCLLIAACSKQAEIERTDGPGDAGNQPIVVEPPKPETPADKAKAADFYRKAAAEGNAAAQTTLGLMYATGDGVEKDEAAAVEWFRKAAAQGHAEGLLNLGLAYADGKGVPKDEPKAADSFQSAASKGDARAQRLLGSMYALGRGVPIDDTVAVGWFKKAAAQGDAEAQHLLGSAFANGDGVPKSDVKAVECYQKAAAQGDATGQRLLGLMYNHGRGIQRDNNDKYPRFPPLPLCGPVCYG